MADINNLTDAELENLSDEELDALIAEEEGLQNASDAELEQMIAEEERVEQEGMLANAEGSDGLDVSTLQSTVLGAAQGITGGSSDEMLAAGMTAFDTIAGDKKFSEISETYQENKAAADQLYADSAAKNPYAHHGSDFAAGVFSPIKAGTLAKNVGLGAIEGYMRGDDVIDAAFGAGFTGAFGMAGRVGSKAIEKATKGKYAGNLIDMARAKVSSEVGEQATTYFKKMLNLEGKNLQTFQNYLKNTGQSAEDVVNDLASIQLKNGKQLLSAKTTDELMDHIPHVVDGLNDEAQGILRLAGEVKGEIDTNKLFKNVTRPLDAIINGKGQLSQNITAAKSIKNDLKQALFKSAEETKLELKDGIVNKVTTIKDEPIKYSPLELKQLQRNFRNTIKKFNTDGDSGSEALRKEVNIALKESVDESILNSIGDDAAKKYRDVTKLESNLLKVQDRLIPSLGKSEQTWADDLGDYLNFRGALAASIAGAAGMPVPAAMGVGIAMNKVLSNRKLNPSMVPKLQKISKQLSANPDKYQHLAAKFAREISTRTGQDRQEEVYKQLGVMEAYIDLEAAPVDRTMKSAYENRHHITALVREVDPNLAKELNAAFNRNDEEAIGQAMGIISKLPEAKPFIQDGIGFEGKLFTKEDIDTVIAQVKANKNLKTRQKRLAIEEAKGGVIPTIQEPQPSKEEKLIKTRIEGRKVEEY